MGGGTALKTLVGICTALGNRTEDFGRNLPIPIRYYTGSFGSAAGDWQIKAIGRASQQATHFIF